MTGVLPVLVLCVLPVLVLLAFLPEPINNRPYYEADGKQYLEVGQKLEPLFLVHVLTFNSIVL